MLNVLNASTDVRLGAVSRTGEAHFDYKFDQICSPLQDCQMKEVPLTGYENCVELMVQILYAE